MNPSARIAAVIAAATVTLAGAGFALATVGQASTASTDPVNASVATTAEQDGPNLNSLARELTRLDDRSSQLATQLANTRARADQVAARNDARTTTVAATSGGGTSQGSAPAPQSSPNPATRHDDDSDDSYAGDDSDDSYDDDAYEDDSDESDDHGDEADEPEYEDEGHDD